MVRTDRFLLDKNCWPTSSFIRKNMNVLRNLMALLVCFSLLGCPSQPTESSPPFIGDMEFPEGVVQHSVMAEGIQWKPCPPHLPPGCAITILEGNPKATGLFSVRFQIDSGFVMPAHTHPRDERVTVISGKVGVAFGLEGTHDSATFFGPGDYYVNARDAIHSVWADTTSIIQITGMGPWEVDFVEK